MSTQLAVRVDDDFADLIDDWRERERKESQSEALRELLRIALKEENAWFQTTTDGGHTVKEWAAERLSKWSDRSMYAALFTSLIGIGAGVPMYLHWIEPTVPTAIIFVLSFSLTAVFALVGGILAGMSVLLLTSENVELHDALPWRRPV